jgi:transcriptional regulator with XRE-family HTH domain
MTDHCETEPGLHCNVDVHVGRRLKLRRLMLGMGAEDLASAVGIGPQNVREYEEGLARISANRLRGFATQLDVPIGWFFEGLDDARETARADRQVGR